MNSPIISAITAVPRTSPTAPIFNWYITCEIIRRIFNRLLEPGYPKVCPVLLLTMNDLSDSLQIVLDGYGNCHFAGIYKHPNHLELYQIAPMLYTPYILAHVWSV